MYINLVRFWLTGMHFFMPFQRNIVKIIGLKNIELRSIELSTLINCLDEITVIVFPPLEIIEFYKNRKFLNRICLIPHDGTVYLGSSHGIWKLPSPYSLTEVNKDETTDFPSHQ